MKIKKVPRSLQIIGTLAVLVGLFFATTAMLPSKVEPIHTCGCGGATATLSPTPFINLYGDLETTNGGGWDVEVIRVVGPAVTLSEMTIRIQSNSGMTIEILERVTSTSTDVSYEWAIMSWYLMGSDAPVIKFVDNGAARMLSSRSAMDVYMDEFKTIEGAVLVFQDMDSDKKLSVGDKILVYRDNNADGSIDVLSNSTISVIHGGDLVGSITLTMCTKFHFQESDDNTHSLK